MELIREANRLGPIESIFNLAVVLQDAVFENQNEESFLISLQPKAVATTYLDEITRKSCPRLRLVSQKLLGPKDPPSILSHLLRQIMLPTLSLVHSTLFLPMIVP